MIPPQIISLKESIFKGGYETERGRENGIFGGSVDLVYELEILNVRKVDISAVLRKLFKNCIIKD